MSRKQPLTVDALWALQRIGAPSLSPDGAQAVAAVTRYSMKDNKSASSLWLMSTTGGDAGSPVCAFLSGSGICHRPLSPVVNNSASILPAT